MRAVPSAVLALVAVPAILAAQAVPLSPIDACRKVNTDAYTARYQAIQDSVKAAGKTLTAAMITPVIAQRTAADKGCAARFSVATTQGTDLVLLANLYSSVGMDSLAMQAMNKRLTEPGMNEAEHAAAYAAMVSLLARGDTAKLREAERYVTALDGLSDAVILQKLGVHAQMNGRYRYFDIDPSIRQHSLEMIALGKRLPPTPPPPPGSRAMVPSTSTLSAYNNLAEVYSDFGHVDSAMMILDQASKDHPEIPAATVESYLGTTRERYKLIGTTAQSFVADHWLNAPTSTKAVTPGRGKVTVVEFTAHWCIPCRNSYPGINTMVKTFSGKPVEFLFMTQFYGYIGDRKNLDPAAEFVADAEYFGKEHEVHFPIGVADQPPPRQANEPYRPNPNDANYKVGGIPQIYVIDQNGVIRRIIEGWDLGNEQRLPVLINELLAEKPIRP